MLGLDERVFVVMAFAWILWVLFVGNTAFAGCRELSLLVVT
jgi:hypothetical protein